MPIPAVIPPARRRARRAIATRLLAGAAAAAAATGVLSAASGPAASAGAATPPASIRLVASGLDQPKKITIAPNGSLVVALSGDGLAPASCTTGNQLSCLDASGAVVEISPSGALRTLLSGLPSVSSGSHAAEASGPAQARIIGGALQVLFQGINISGRTGEETYGAGGALLGDLVRFTGHSPRIEARFGPFEAAHNPDHGRGTVVALNQESPIDIDPYAFVPYRGGFAVADAGGNDLLFVSRTGRISVLAVFPTISETAPPGAFGTAQTRSIHAQAQAVPDALAVGPDGALYVGELGGSPYGVGKSSVFRVVPGHAPTVYARGLTSIGDIAFDGRTLLVLEIDQKGLLDPALAPDSTSVPTPGAIVGVSPSGRQSLLVSRGLEFPTGMAVTRAGAVYVATEGIYTPGPVAGSGGKIVSVTLP
ncbi:MAG: ScyD/ScyE family protein [Solirubrobacteraceae bacterium]